MIILYCLIYLFIGWLSTYLFDEDDILTAELIVFIWPVLFVAVFIASVLYNIAKTLNVEKDFEEHMKNGMLFCDELNYFPMTATEIKLREESKDRTGFIGS